MRRRKGQRRKTRGKERRYSRKGGEVMKMELRKGKGKQGKEGEK